MADRAGALRIVREDGPGPARRYPERMSGGARRERYRDLPLPQWRELVNRSFVPLIVRENCGVLFRGSMVTTVLDEICVYEIEATPHIVERTEELIAGSGDAYLKLSLALDGFCVLEQDGRTARISPGDLAVYDTSRPYRLAFETDNRALVIMVPHRLIDLPPGELARLTAVRFAHDTALGRVVNSFFQDLGTAIHDLRDPAGIRLVHTALDLLVTLLSSEHRVGDARDPQRALLRDIREYIDARLGDPDLTPTSIAKAHFISTRHLHAIFTNENVTLASWIRERRLEHIRRDLVDPLFASEPINRIAARWGLVDAAHFSKAFKLRFGMGPRAYRTRDAAEHNSAAPKD